MCHREEQCDMAISCIKFVYITVNYCGQLTEGLQLQLDDEFFQFCSSFFDVIFGLSDFFSDKRAMLDDEIFQVVFGERKHIAGY